MTHKTPQVSLTEVAFFQEGPGLRKWQWTPDGMKVINVTNILGDAAGTVDVSNTDKFISLVEFEEKYKHFAVEHRDIVVASSGNTYGKVGRINQSCLPLMMNTSVIRFHSLDANKLDDDYLYVFLRSPEFRNQVEQFVIGGAQPNFGPSHLKKMVIPLPDITIQRRIGEFLSAYDDLIENNRRRIQLLEQAARLLYKEWFVHLRFPGYEHAKVVDGVPEGWEKKLLGDVCFEVRETVSPNDLEPNTPYIGLEHMPRRSITLCEWGQAEQVTSGKHRFREGEILFGKIRPYFHKVGIALTDGMASSDAIIIRPTSPHLLAFVLLTTSSDWFVTVTAQQMKEGSKMPRADWKQMQKYLVPLPPEGLLRALSDIIDPILSQLKTLAFANKRISIARDLLLPKLMNGEVAV